MKEIDDTVVPTVVGVMLDFGSGLLSIQMSETIKQSDDKDVDDLVLMMGMLTIWC